MKSKQRSAAIILLLLLGATLYVLVRTRTAAPTLASPSTNQDSNAGQTELVDQRPLQTAQQFAKMATSAEEKPFAKQALALGDHEMDLAFAEAVQDAQEHPADLSNGRQGTRSICCCGAPSLTQSPGQFHSR